MSFIEKAKEKYGKEFAKQMIQEYMKKKKYSIEEFIKENPHYTNFEQNTRPDDFNYANIIKNHGIQMDEESYQEIIEMIKEEELQKNKLNTNIKTTNINGHEIATITDKNTGEKKIFDNTVSNRTIEDQMKTVQQEHSQFQSLKDNNTLNTMQYMEDNIKITPNITSTDNIDENNIVNEEREIAIAARNFELLIGHHVDIDLNSKMIYDNDIIYSIEKRDGKYEVIEQNSTNFAQKKNDKGPQLVMRKNTTDKVA